MADFDCPFCGEPLKLEKSFDDLGKEETCSCGHTLAVQFDENMEGETWWWIEEVISTTPK